MAVSSRAAPTTQATLTRYVERGMEVLWLLTAAVVPLIFLDTSWVLSEAVNAYVEVPKTTSLRILAGLMAILWIVEWALKGGLTRQYNLASFSTTLKEWLWEQPSRWVVVAAIFYVVVAIITTLLSQNFFISLWGEVSGQFGYSLYTTASYFVLFAVVATHLKTRDQLYRLLAVIVTTGFLVALYGIIQHYDLDPLDQGEAGSGRVASTMANPVFCGAALVATTLMTLGVGLALLDRLGWSLIRVVLWVALVAVQLMALFWTGSRGSWLIGVPLGLIAFLSLPPFIDAFTNWLKQKFVPLDLLILLALLVLLDILVILGIIDVLNLMSFRGFPTLRVLLGLFGLLAFLGELTLLFPTRFTLGVRTFSKTFLVLASGLLITLLVITLTPASPDTPELDLKDLPGLPNSQILLGLLWALSFLPLLFLAWFTWGKRAFEKIVLVVASGMLIALLVVALTPATLGTPGGGEESTAAAADIAEGPTPGEAQATGRGLSYRNNIWEASWGLIVNRPWFEYEDLSLSFVRPLIGYGPELFKYTFPLESPLGGLLSHSHNFWIHHFVEQGILGVLSSVGLFVAFFAVGLAQLWRNWASYSTVHRWILLTIVATVVGRMAEMMVGTARESDLVTFWIMLAVLVVLPSAMASSPEVQASPAGVAPLVPPRRAERRAKRPDRRERRAARRANRGYGTPIGLLQATGIVLVSALVIGIGWLTWDKNVDYLWASRIAAQARDQFIVGQFPEAHRLMSKATAKAPDVPIYHNNLAAMYDAYARQIEQVAANNPDARFQSCAEFFSLDTRPDGPVNQDHPYADCAEEAYISNLRGFLKNPTAPQVKRPLAASTLQLAVEGYVGKDEEAIRYYTELTQMVPSSLLDYNNLINAYFKLRRPKDALASTEVFLAISRNPLQTSHGLYIQGVAYRQLGDPQKAIAAFEKSLAASRANPNAGEIRRQLVNAYETVAVPHLQENRAAEALPVLERALAVTQGSSSSARALYLRGVAYRQLDQPYRAVDSLEQSLHLDEKGPNAAEAHGQLAAVYAALGDQARAEEHSKLQEGLKKP